MKLEKLISKLNYSVVCGDTDIDISDVIYDSRKVSKGCLFVCLVGSAADGHKYAQAAADAGAAAIIVSKDTDISGAAVIKTDDTRKALAFISAEFFGNPADTLKTIGITGTKGKTTTAMMIRSILEKGGIKTGVIGTIGIMIGDKLIKTSNTTPESYEIQKAMRQMIDEGCKCVVMEASSLGLKWHRTDGFIFDYGIFTNFSHDHIGGVEHKDMEEYAECKAMLFRQCRTGIFNIDDPKTPYMEENASCSIETFGFSENAELRASDEHLISRAGYLGVRFNVSGKLSMTIDAGTPGKFNVYNDFKLFTENVLSYIHKTLSCPKD